jgi:NADPH:quinone reductase
MAAKTRRVVTMDGAGRIGVQEEPIPELKGNMILVKVESCLISPGTELHAAYLCRQKPKDTPPQAFGYGNAGIVEKVGKGVEGVKEGDRLACMGGGFAIHGSYAVMPKNMVTPIPEGVSFDEAAFAHLAATGLHAVRRSGMEFGQNIAVFGLGIVGQCIAQISRLSGGHVMAIDMVDERLAVAKTCGVHRTINPKKEDPIEVSREFTRGYGLDIGHIAFGGNATPAIKQIQKMLKRAPDTHRMGVIVIVGWAQMEAEFPVPFGNADIRPSSRPGPGYHDPDWEMGRDYPPAFVDWTTKRNMEECLRFCGDGLINYEALITHRIKIDDAPEACEELINSPGTAMGVIVHPWQ